MPQFSKGDTFSDGQQVTGVRLNGLVDNATALPGLITDQTNLTANTVASNDSVLLHDLSAGALREATAGDLLNSNLPITTSSVSGVSGSDITVIPAAGQKFDVNGAFESTTSNTTGNSTVGGNHTVSGNLLVTGSSTLTGNVIADNGFTSNGVANFTGTLQVNGSTAYVLYEVYQETLPAWVATVAGNFAAVVTTASFTKPADEIWKFEIDGTWTMVRGYGAEYGFRYSTETFQTGSYIDFNFDYSSGVTWLYTRSINHTWTVPAGTALTARTIVVDVSVGSGSQLRMFQSNPVYTTLITTGNLPPSVFRIYKYKTA